MKKFSKSLQFGVLDNKYYSKSRQNNVEPDPARSAVQRWKHGGPTSLFELTSKFWKYTGKNRKLAQSQATPTFRNGTPSHPNSLTRKKRKKNRRELTSKCSCDEAQHIRSRRCTSQLICSRPSRACVPSFPFLCSSADVQPTTRDTGHPPRARLPREDVPSRAKTPRQRP